MFKVDKVIPIYKKGDEHDKKNFRPISILPGMSMILERHVSKYLKKYLETNYLLYKLKSGILKHHSCQTALINILDD